MTIRLAGDSTQTSSILSKFPLQFVQDDVIHLTIHVWCRILPLATPCHIILGDPWLTHYKAVLAYASRTLLIRNKRIVSLTTKKESTGCYHVRKNRSVANDLMQFTFSVWCTFTLRYLQPMPCPGQLMDEFSTLFVDGIPRQLKINDPYSMKSTCNRVHTTL